MEITRTSMTSGVTRTLDLPVTDEQMLAWRNGALIQEAMPDLTDYQREFILTGITADEWDEIFPEEDEDEPEPCTADARTAGCTCRMESVNSASIDPPEPIVDRDCPLHGYGEDPDAAYDRMRDVHRDDDEPAF